MSDVADVTDEVVEQASSFIESSSEASGHGFGLALGGFVLGAGLGAAAGYFFCRKQLETKYNDIAEEEIASMREHYQAKAVALENTVDKPKLEEIIRDKGYSTEPPMAVEPPASVIEAAEEAREKETTQTEVVEEEPEVQNIFDRDEPQEEDGWDYQSELRRRSPVRPYAIHIDEKDEYDTYDQLTYTYYEADDVLCNESDDVIAGPDRDRQIGETNLNRFGHGSGDPNVVYVRNDQMETVFEICRSPNSFAEEVHGFQHSEIYPRKRRRVRYDDE